VSDGDYIIRRYSDMGCDRNRVDECIEGVSNAVFAPYHSFKVAHCVYEFYYHTNKLRACPIHGGKFWPAALNDSSPAISSSSSSGLWDQLEDLSKEFNSIELTSPSVSSSSSDCLWDQLEDISEEVEGLEL
jgi:hypothetical protein